MKILFFMKGIVKSLSKGDVFRNIFSALLKTIAFFTVIAAIVGFFWGFDKLHDDLGFLTYEKAFRIFSALLVLLIEGWMLFQILWIRSDVISDIPESDYNVVPIVAVLLKTTGEVISIYIAVGTIIFWLDGGYLVNTLLFERGFPTWLFFSSISYLRVI